MNRFVLATVMALCCMGAAHAGVTEEDLAKDQQSTGDVLTNGMGRGLQRFSPLETLNKKNVKNLVPAWAFSLGGEKQRGQESQPIVYDGMMYITGSYSRIYAIDLKTGKVLWKDVLPAGGQATPMTYLGADGRQYVVVAAGGHGSLGTKTGDSVIAYALPK